MKRRVRYVNDRWVVYSEDGFTYGIGNIIYGVGNSLKEAERNLDNFIKGVREQKEDDNVY